MFSHVVRVLYLEDDAQLVERISNILRPYNFQVVAGPSGEQGFPLISEIKPELVMLGLMSLQTDNWKVHRQIREAEDLRRLPILVVTDKLQEYDRIPGLISTPVDDYISHPFEPGQLILRLRNLLGRA